MKKMSYINLIMALAVFIAATTPHPVHKAHAATEEISKDKETKKYRESHRKCDKKAKRYARKHTPNRAYDIISEIESKKIDEILEGKNSTQRSKRIGEAIAKSQQYKNRKTLYDNRYNRCMETKLY